MFRPAKIFFVLLVAVVGVGKGYDLYHHSTAPAHAQPTNNADAAKENKTQESAQPPSNNQTTKAEENDTKPLTDFTSSEIKLLQSLRERREQLAIREAAVEEREKLLNAMEGQIEAKINEMNIIKGQIESIKKEIEERSKQFDAKQDDQAKMLVRVYEKMKPKDVAVIFNNLELTILLDVTKSMREAKLAPVMAMMNPEKAMILSSELARRKALPKIPE